MQLKPVLHRDVRGRTHGTRHMHRDGLSVDAMNATAVFMSFLIAVYLVGDKLKKRWATALVILYTAFLPGPIGGAYERIAEMKLISEKYIELYPEGAFANRYTDFVNDPVFVVVLAPLLPGWFLSVTYLIARVREAA